MALTHDDLVGLLAGGVVPGVWADLGSGPGAFTMALADLLGGEGEIHSVDRDGAALARQRRTLGQRFAQSRVIYRTADFTRALDLPPLDGVVMANSLHFVRDKAPVLALLHSYLRPGGRLLLVEYDSDRGNQWVPHPLSYESWKRLAAAGGFEQPSLLATLPSRFLDRIYSALSLRSGESPGG